MTEIRKKPSILNLGRKLRIHYFIALEPFLSSGGFFGPHSYSLEYKRQLSRPQPPKTTLPSVYMKFDFCQPSFGQVRLNIQQNGRRQQRIAVTFVFILFSLTAVLSVALDVFMELLLEMKINEEMLIAQAALRRN